MLGQESNSKRATEMADSNLGNNLISAMGMGSFDVTAMVSGLSEAERAPVTARLDTKQETYQAKLDAYNSVQEAMSGFKSLLAEIDDLQKLQGRTLSSSDTSVFTATANTTGAQASPGSYEVEVTSLAKAHSLYSGAFTNTTDTIGTGSLTFSFGKTVYDAGTDTYTSFTRDPAQTSFSVNIDSSNNTLLGVRDAINAQNKGVNASIVNDGTGYRLVFSSTSTGANHSMEVSVNDTGDSNNTNLSGLSRLAFNSGATNLAQSSAATSASAKVNGLTVTSETNSISNVVDGVTLNLKNTSVGKTNSLSITHDTETVKTAITNFVGDYNALMTVFDEHAKYSGGEAGALQSESLVRSMLNDIKSGVSAAISQLPVGYQTLADVGISNDRYGKMELDTEKLDTALKNNFDSVARLFTKSGSTSDPLSSYVSANQYTKVDTYTVTVNTAGKEATKGAYTGTADSYLLDTVKIDSKNEYFKLKLDGVQNAGTSSGRIYLEQKTYANAEALATELQTKINADTAFVAAGSSVTVSVDRTETNPKFVFTSNKSGSSSSVEFTQIDQNTDTELGIFATAGTTGTDEVKAVVNIKGATETTGWDMTASSAYRIESIFGNSRGLSFDTRAAAGTTFTIDYTEGAASKLDGILERVLKKGEVLEKRIEGLNDSLEEIDEDRTKLDERIAKMEETWRRQFNTLNTLMGQMQSTGSFLENTFKSMNGGDD